jgi:hypothetical protein
MTRENCIKETVKHIERVDELLTGISGQLLDRGDNHDKSKLESPELEIFMEYTPKLKDCTYGSEEYKTYLAEMKVALDHHYANNSHHPENSKDGIKGMNLVDIIEMFCDWVAASERHENGDIRKSIEINKERFNMSDDLVQILLNSVKML